MTLRAFVVDDEPLAIKRLTRLLEATGRVEVVGTAGDGETALASLCSAEVDVLFLDIQMPGLSGLEVARRLPQATRVVFTTAYDQYAVKAFETSAVDYLLKPVESERLDRTLDRLERLRREPSGDEIRAALAKLAEDLRSRTPSFAERITSRIGERVQVIETAEVTHFFARDKGTYAVTSGGTHLIDATIAELEKRLDPARFIRIHRATLVNLAFVHELHPLFGGRLVVKLKDDKRTELEVARDRARTLKERVGA
jgi:two-component system LytT family response regulator